MPQVVYKDGSPVPPEKVASAIASGDAFTSGEKVTVRNQRTGEVGTIDPGELAHSTHYSVLSDEEMAAEANHAKYGTLGQQAITGLEGAARGATAGLSDVALTGVLGNEYRKGAKARQTENPVAAAASEVGGAIAPALLTGGASAEAEGAALGAEGIEGASEGAGLLSKAASLAPSNLISRAGGAVGRGVEGIIGTGAESMLGRMAQRAAAVGASGAVEGGLYGAGSAASQNALDGSPITAEKVLSGFGHGALFGGGLGLGLGAAEGAASSAIERIVGSDGLQASARKLADKSALDAVGFQGSDYRRLAGRGNIEDKIADAGGELLNYTFDSGPLKGRKLFTGASKAEDFVDDLALAKQEVGAKLGAIKQQANDAMLANPELAPDVNAYLGRVQSEVLEPLRASLSPTKQKMADKVFDELKGLESRAAPDINGLVPAPLTFNELDAFRRDLRSVFQPPRPPGGGLPAPVPEHAEYLEKAERMLADDLDRSVQRHLEASGLDTSEYLRNKKTYGALADIEKVANKSAAQQLGNRSVSPSDYATGLGTAIGMMVSGNVGAMLSGGAATVAHKIIRERGRSVLAVMADSVAKMDGRIAGATQALAGLASAPQHVALELAPAMIDRFDETTKAVRAIRDDPTAAAAALAKPVEGIDSTHPQLAAQMQQTLMGDHQYLASKLPIVLSRSSTSLTPQLEKSRVPRSEKVKFMSIVQALENPGAVLDKVARGELPMVQINALKDRRPEIFNQMRLQAIKAFSSAKKPRSILERTRVSLAFGFSGDASLEPANLAAIQASNRMAPTPPDKPATPAPEARPQTAHLNPKNAADMSTPSQTAIGG